MVLAPFLFKARALGALKGNWQTALLVSFFSGIMTTIGSVLYAALMPDLTVYTTPQGLLDAVEAIPQSTWIILSVLSVLSFIITPMLQLGANHYFISRLKGVELGFGGLLSRVGLWGKALWLSILIGVKVLLWSLLLVVPGIIAGIRYSMAYYYLAQDPSLSAWEALEKSKNAMQNTKMSYFALALSFLGWMLLSNLVQSGLLYISFVLALVAYQFIELFISTYMNGAYAAFFLAVSEPKGLEKLQRFSPMGGRPMGFPLGGWPGREAGEDLTGEDLTGEDLTGEYAPPEGEEEPDGEERPHQDKAPPQSPGEG